MKVQQIRQLIDTQFPKWKELALTPLYPKGWDNHTFRLGDALLVRLPSSEAYASQVKKEQKWLPPLAPHLPLQIPEPVAMGEPSSFYPWHWSIYRFLPGKTVTETKPDLIDSAKRLAHFLTAFHQIDASEGPPAGRESFYRGSALKVYDREVREALEQLKNQVDTKKALTIWEEALESHWTRPPVWVHGDLSPSNLLTENGKLTSVIDFGQLCTGDPACDTAIAWTLFNGQSRETFFQTLSLDDQTYQRGQAWGLWKALITLAKSTEAHKHEKTILQQTLEELC